MACVVRPALSVAVAVSVCEPRAALYPLGLTVQSWRPEIVSDEVQVMLLKAGTLPDG